MGSGISRTFVGSFTGTGSAIDVKKVGFRPRAIEVLNITGLCTGKWVEGMADASVVKAITDGTISVPTTGGITPLADGFTLGTDTDLNVSGELCRFVCHE